jgi:hypothetical protein
VDRPEGRGYRRDMAEQGDSGDAERERTKTPFDNPLFLPVMLWLFALWFGYDAFLNADEHMQVPTTLWFNRIGFPIFVVLALWFTRQGLREKRDTSADAGSRDAETDGRPPAR